MTLGQLYADHARPGGFVALYAQSHPCLSSNIPLDLEGWVKETGGPISGVFYGVKERMETLRCLWWPGTPSLRPQRAAG